MIDTYGKWHEEKDYSLCERCAGKISLEMYKTRMEMLNGFK